MKDNNNDVTIRRDVWMKDLEAVKKKPYMTNEERKFFKDAIKMGASIHQIFTKGIFEKTFGYRLGRNAIYERVIKIREEMIESGELKGEEK